jgi:hypothetical protein
MRMEHTRIYSILKWRISFLSWWRRCLFFVKVDKRPLTDVWSSKDKKEIVIVSINSMTKDNLTYKNLHHIKRIINQ